MILLVCKGILFINSNIFQAALIFLLYWGWWFFWCQPVSLQVKYCDHIPCYTKTKCSTEMTHSWTMTLILTGLDTILTFYPFHSISQMCWDRGSAVSIYLWYTSGLFKNVPASVGIICMLCQLMILTTVVCIGEHIMVVGKLLIVMLVHC